MRPNALGYIGVGSSDLNDWEDFGIGLVGLQCGDSSSQFRAFRMDDRKSRLLIDGTHPDGECFFGWEVSNADELDRFGAKLDGTGFPRQLHLSSPVRGDSGEVGVDSSGGD